MPRRKRFVRLLDLGALLLTACTYSLAAQAATLTVPDQAPTIQAALDASVDTVLVRPGVYSETPIVTSPVSLLAVTDGSKDLPLLDGLTIRVRGTGGSSTLFDFQQLTIRGQVLILSDYGTCDIGFRRCDLRNGVRDDSVWGDTWTMSLHRCSVSGSAALRARNWVYVDSCEVTGQMSACGPGSGLLVRGCRFEGSGTGTAISTCSIGGCYVDGNTIRGYATGVSVSAEEEAVVSNNLVEDCGRCVNVGTNHVTVANNLVRRCERGIVAYSRGGVSVIGNKVTEARVIGIFVSEAGVNVVGNIVWDCGQDGMKVVGPGIVSQNTSCRNGGSGFVSENGDEYYGLEWLRNIGYANRAYGLSWPSQGMGSLSCNDWFANGAGDIEGRPASGEDFSVDPQFCDPEGGDFHLDSASELPDWPGCGLVGALGLGCGKTATLVQRFTAGRVSDGIQVVWEVAEGATASEVWLERSDGANSESWSRPLTERSLENRAVVELDRSAVSDRAYRYRLIAREGSDDTVIGPAIAVGAQARPESHLVQVGPNPGSGPVKIAFALKHAAAIEIDVFDVQGRRVASPGRGVWPPGTHTLEWSGRTHSGEAASAGVYLVRYAYPGGQDRRVIVRVR